ncbi:hypothetical protein [Streptomyces fagopyri]|uniref:hypothetical protein n=1 Tax=Streptomyces fagopyri TaxID=2662397 RepID=UPI0037231496
MAVGTPRGTGSGFIGPGSGLIGTGSGLTGTGTGVKSFGQDIVGVLDTAQTRDTFAAAPRRVDADHDGRTDLVVGAPGENANAGSVRVPRSASSG